jgi:predicted anti-sigma-YlaC factor YlaD
VDADRREFEAHLGECPSCRDAVTKLSGMPTLLSLLDRDEVAAIDEHDQVSSSAAVPEAGVAGGCAVWRAAGSRNVTQAR